MASQAAGIDATAALIASSTTCVYVAAQWPDVTRVTSQTYTTHKMLAAREDRHEIIAEQVWTYNSLSIRLDRKPNPSRVTPDHEPGNEVRQSVHGLPSMLSEALSSEGSKEALMRISCPCCTCASCANGA